MKESEIAVMEEFIDDIKVVINTLGYKVLEPLVQHGISDKSDENDKLYINTGSAKAVGQTTTEGFVVFQGAVINEKISRNSINASIVKLREKFFAEEKVKNLITTEDLLFNSSSAAADFVLGYSASGPKTWKNKNGKSLKEIEAEKNE